MTGKVRRVDFYPDEYISGVGGVLRAEEQGIYWLVCSLVMSEGGPIEYNERRLSALCMARPSDIRRVVERLVSKGKLTLSNGKLSQKRAQSEVELASKRIQSAAENGAKGGRPRVKTQQNQQKTEPKPFPDEKLTTNYQLPTTTEESASACPKPAKRRHSYSPEFEQFWADYPTDPLMSKKQAADVFESLADEDKGKVIASLPAFKAYCSQHPDYRPVHANRYISQQRYEGFVKVVKAVDDRIFVALGSETWRAIMAKRGVVSMQSTNHKGQRGWWFTKSEIAASAQQAQPINWQTAGAA